MIEIGKEDQVLVDLEFLDSRRFVGEGFIEKLIDVFGEEAPKLVRRIKSEAGKLEAKELAELGHKLKGMSINVGANRLSDMGKRIELAAKSGDREALTQNLNQLDGVLELTLEEMKKVI